MRVPEIRRELKRARGSMAALSRKLGVSRTYVTWALQSRPGRPVPSSAQATILAEAERIAKRLKEERHGV